MKQLKKEEGNPMEKTIIMAEKGDVLFERLSQEAFKVLEILPDDLIEAMTTIALVQKIMEDTHGVDFKDVKIRAE
jgi:hypothetical protein